MTEPCDLSAREARRQIGQKTLSPVELVDSCIGRVDAVDGAVNAMVTRCFERARNEAKSAEEAVMRGDRKVRLLLPAMHKAGKARSGSSKKRTTAQSRSSDFESFDINQQELFEALREHRLEVARLEGVAPYVVASDRTLREIVLDRPTTDAELQQIHGIAATKAERYGEGLLSIVKEWVKNS